MIFYSKYSVELFAEKTRLQMFPCNQKHPVDLESIVNPIRISKVTIDFSTTAEHVGILRSTDGNVPTIVARIESHKRALAAVLHWSVPQSQRKPFCKPKCS